MSPSRRVFLGGSAAALAMGGLARLAEAARAEDPYGNEVFGYGALLPDPKGLLDLPQGFSYRVISRAGEPMDDGLFVPQRADGMGCFPAGAGRVLLVRNHENNELDQGAFGPGFALASKADPAKVYDRQGDVPLPGGTTTLLYDPATGRTLRQHLSLAGTRVNCAGGITPRRSWLTCEETVDAGGGSKTHGWVFEVPADARGLADPAPLTGMGRFVHEATCTDPATGVVYLTEDSQDALFYRFLPNDPRALAKGGRLQALSVEGLEDARNWSERTWSAGDRRRVRWIDLDGVDSADNDLRHRGHARGATRFAREEGIWWGDGELFFACTSGGVRRDGQIMRYRPDGADTGELQLFLESDNPALLRMCDNLTVAPFGHLIVCEDRARNETNYLRGVTADGRLYTLARNAGSDSEFAGACFSPDGSTLFVNLQEDGLTLAIAGPWNGVRL
jgi:uncharacterized protein